MRYYSTKNRRASHSLREAILLGLAPDGGLFMPQTLPSLEPEFWHAGRRSMTQTASEILGRLLMGDVPQEDLQGIVERVFNFPVPVVDIEPGLSVLELTHGPSASFKDFGARFLAELLGFFARGVEAHWTVLVATSGDTGSAVAQGFYGVPGVEVVILYPKGRVSGLQEAQLTTLGGNITALEVDGVFDDCQALVKQAFADQELRAARELTSANSISIGRLFPQSVYYAHAWFELGAPPNLLISVPSGNFGNLTAGLMAKRMGLPVEFLSAMNANDVVLEFLEGGEFQPRPSVATLSNAMDVGNPSNFARLLDLFDQDVAGLRAALRGVHVSDALTRATMQDVYQRTGYTLDPHGAVAFAGAQMMRGERPALVLETAHPAKFADVVREETGVEPEIPQRLASCLTLPKHAVPMSRNFEDFKKFLLAT